MKRAGRGGGSLQIVAALAMLWTVVLAGVVLSAGYALGVPPWNAPDEPAHYNYVKQVATRGELPELRSGDWDAALLERLKASRFPPSEPVDSIRYEGWQPPLFYLLASPLYRASAQLPLLERVGALRLLSVALSGVTVVLAFLAVRAVFRDDLPLQLSVAGFIAFLPMRSAIAGSVSNDALAEMVATLLLLLLIRISQSGLKKGYAVLLGLTLGIALLTKMTLYGLVLLSFLVAALASRGSGRSGEPSRRGFALRPLGITAGVALLVAGWWFVRNALLYGGMDLFGSIRHDQVVIGQPRPEQLDASWLGYFAPTLFKSFWGQFGWMGILIDDRLYLLLGVISGLAALGLLLFLRRAVFEKGLLSPHQRSSLGIMALAAAVVVAQLVVYNLSFIQAQGRYLYPALLPIAFFLVLGLRELMAPVHARLLLVLSMGSLALLNYVCLSRYVLPYFNP